MSGKVIYTSYEYANVNLVSVIASFDTDGHMKPLYVRIGENSYKIHSSWLKPSFSGILEYNCKIIDDNILKPLILTYHDRESVWTIPKIMES